MDSRLAQSLGPIGETMKHFLLMAVLILLALQPVIAQESEDADDAPSEKPEENKDVAPGGAKTLSGMSILGNEETPKSLVIVPWKSSEMGDELSLSDTLDDRAKPVDKEVFLRELSFYRIRSEK